MLRLPFARFVILVFLLGHPVTSHADDLRDSQVQGLSAALGTYRAIAATGGWPALPPGPVLERGKSDWRVGLLRERLRRSSDLTEIVAGPVVDDGLAAAISRFQRRHGLAVDGRVGAATLAALNVSAASRVEQLEVNLRRWHDAPALGPTYLRVNAAAQTLEFVKSGVTVLHMPVIVGERRHPTPEFVARLTGVLFNPSWTVPRSIVANEIVPRLRRDPGYLERENIRILGRDDDPFGRAIDWKRFSPARGLPQLRQDPGPGNALGLIKFDVPNRYDVYLHDTPGKALFGKSVRAFSHGCIRLSQPRELAAALLGDAGWTMTMVDEAVAQQTTQRVPVEPAVPVHVAYFTAFVDPDGAVAFRDDLYGRDEAVSSSLSGSTAGTPAQPKSGVGCGE